MTRGRQPTQPRRRRDLPRLTGIISVDLPCRVRCNGPRAGVGLLSHIPQIRIRPWISKRREQSCGRSIGLSYVSSCHRTALSEWPFPLEEGGEPTTRTTELGGLLQDSISRVPAPVI